MYMLETFNPLRYFDAACARNDAAPCLVNGVTGQALSYGEVSRSTKQIAAGLRKRPSVRRVGILSPNDMRAYIAQLGCYRAGIIAVCGDARIPAVQNVDLFQRFEVDVVIVHPDLDHTIAEMVDRLVPGIEVICLESGALAGIPGLHDWCGPGQWDGAVMDDPEQPYAIQPTGGTTGLPKGVVMPVRELGFLVESLLDLAPFEGLPVFLAAVPLTHAAGKIMHGIFAQGGCGVVLPGADPAAVLAAIARWRVTHTFLPPTVIYRLLDSGMLAQHDTSSLRYLLYGASPISPSRLAEAVTAFGPVLAQVYGQTESGLPICFMAPGDHLGPDGAPASRARLSSAGRINPRCELEIHAPDGTPLPQGEAGEIAVRGAGVMLGYQGNPEETEAVFEDGWLKTGDIAFIDDEGFVHIVDRARDLIISGGFNVYPAEVERAINSCDAVSDCAVVGMPHEQWGEAVTAVVVVKPGQSTDEAAIIALCKAQLGSIKAPKQVIFADSLPRSPAGKVLKREIRSQFWAGKERQL